MDYLLSEVFITCISAVTVRSLHADVMVVLSVITVQNFQKISIPSPHREDFCDPHPSLENFQLSPLHFFNVLVLQNLPPSPRNANPFRGGVCGYFLYKHIACSRQGQHSDLVPVVQRVDNAIQWISIGETNYTIRWIVLFTL